MDATLLSRIQFAVTVGYHILFPAFTIGTVLFLVLIEGMWLKTRDKTYLSIYKFWAKLFALGFGMGVITGIPMAFQFGTNFSRFAQFASPVMGPLFASEILTAFFLEAVFVGVMLFGWKKVPPVVHFLATILVAVGTHNSALWILVFNSWMQTPAGVEVTDGVLTLTSMKDVIFNPSMIPMLSHMLLASYLTASLAVLGTSAYLVLSKKPEFVKNLRVAKKAMSISLWLVLILSLSQAVVGDILGVVTYEHQPLKVAVMEGNWDTRNGIPSILFAIPDPINEVNKFEIGIPKLSSLLIRHSLDGEIVGIKNWPKEDRPPIGMVFWSFRIMVGIGLLAVAIASLGLLLRFANKLDNKWFLRACICLTPMGFVAVIAGWIVAESGRQPWIIYGLMRTKDALSPIISGQVVWSLSTIVFIYTALMVSLIYYVRKVVLHGYVVPELIEVYGEKNLKKL